VGRRILRRPARRTIRSPSLSSSLHSIASRAPDFFKIPHDAVIEVGFRVEV
jgi:KUP system potassium uptake protein